VRTASKGYRTMHVDAQVVEYPRRISPYVRAHGSSIPGKRLARSQPKDGRETQGST
jgi:hypothetical protein